MADLNFAIEKVEAVRFAATPMLAFRLRVTNADPGEAILHRRAALPDSN